MFGLVYVMVILDFVGYVVVDLSILVLIALFFMILFFRINLVYYYILILYY